MSAVAATGIRWLEECCSLSNLCRSSWDQTVDFPPYCGEVCHPAVASPHSAFASAAAVVRVLLCFRRTRNAGLGRLCLLSSASQSVSQAVSQGVPQATVVWFDKYCCAAWINPNPMMVCPDDQYPNINLVNPCFPRLLFDQYILSFPLHASLPAGELWTQVVNVV